MKTAISWALAAVAMLTLPVTAQNQQGTGEDSLSNPGSAFAGNGRSRSWHAEVEQTERGFMIGNPEAEASLIEFISYTCSHCASFAREGEGAIDMVLLAPGLMNVEVRPVIRNGIDLAVSLLVQCGGADGFKDRHRMYLSRQQQWLGKAQSAPQAQQAVWARGDRAARINAATALDLDDMLADRGMSRIDITACLSDDQAALELIRNGQADATEFAVRGTPSFALDGELLDDVHSWATLYPVLEERFRPGNGQE
ncbi:MAG: DsbA family protein [Erythrobacter sp.]